MAYGVKYRGDFYNANNEICRVDICQDGYSGSITDIIFGDTPVTRVMDSANKPIYDIIKTTSLEINLKKEYFTQYEEFLNTDDKSYLVRLYENSIQTFSGWLITSGITEPYRSVPYIISLQAVDGINRLKDVTFTTPPEIYTRQFYGAEYYKAWRVSFKEVFTQVLAALPPDYTLRSYSGIFAYDNSIGYNLFNANTYINYELVKGKNIYEVLEIITQGLGYKIIIDSTIIRIFGLKEQEEWAYGRSTDYTDYNSAFDVTATSSEAYTFLTIGNELKLLTGGTKTKKPAYKEVNVEVDWGRLDNILIPGEIENAVTIDDSNTATLHFYDRSSTLVDVIVKETSEKQKVIDVNYNSNNYNYDNNFAYLHFRLKDVPPLDSTKGRLKFTLEFKLGDTDKNNLDHYFTVVNEADFLGFRVVPSGFPSYESLANIQGIIIGPEPTRGWSWRYINTPTPIHYQEWNNATQQWQVQEVDIVGRKPFSRNDFMFIITPADHQSDNEVHPLQIKKIGLTFYNKDSNGNKILYPTGENVKVVNNAQGLFLSETVKVQLSSMPAIINGETAYNTMHIYKAAILVETGTEQFIVVNDTYHAKTPTQLEPLQDYVGKIAATSTMISQSVVNCDLKGYLPSWLNPIYNIEEPSVMYFIGSGSYDVKRMRGKYELLQYVPYVGFDWSNIITEDSDIIESEDGLATLITEINMN